MGVDESAVVDPQLRVRGTTGLRVADASIMPELVSVNTERRVHDDRLEGAPATSSRT